MFHLATHGVFGGNNQDSFILTYDGRLTINDLERLIRLNPFRKHKLELLSLSACQTAFGDDRSALGLAGVAVKSGAKSVIGSLWYIDDEAASLVTREFYYRLMHSQKQPATILQEVQIELIALPRFKHPAYWAPFLLIGNWI
jgi:CHAT domain-containing protein